MLLLFVLFSLWPHYNPCTLNILFSQLIVDSKHDILRQTEIHLLILCSIISSCVLLLSLLVSVTLLVLICPLFASVALLVLIPLVLCKLSLLNWSSAESGGSVYKRNKGGVVVEGECVLHDWSDMSKLLISCQWCLLYQITAWHKVNNSFFTPNTATDEVFCCAGRCFPLNS